MRVKLSLLVLILTSLACTANISTVSPTEIQSSTAPPEVQVEITPV